MNRRAVAAVGVILVLLGLVGPLGPAGAILDDASASAPDDGPATWIVVEVDAAGDAHWSIESRFDVSTADRRAAFEDVVARAEAGEGPYEVATFEAYRDRAAAVVNRSMSIEDASWEHHVEDDVGVLSFTFTWTDFAHTGDGRLEVGDAFQSPSGTWFESLGPDTWLTIAGPEDAAVATSPPGREVVDGAVTWEGPTTFDPGDLTVAYRLAGTGNEIDAPTAVALAVVLVGFAGVLWWMYRREQAGGGHPTASSPEAAPPDEDDAPVDRIDEELLSDPERVERLLEDHGGRMKQADIVEATDWSTAKVSQLLSEMAEEGRVEKLRLGQENLISLPNDDT
ncbi:MAG: helix-turn-helix transcriptional regulator [Halobacteriales archaeon]